MRSVYAGIYLASLMPILAFAAIAVPPFKHLGVATCSTSVCHGKLAPQVNKHVNLNEYRIWLQEDRHAKAFQKLDSAKSKAIAAKLGLASAKAAKICLDCHTDSVPASQRGPKFQVTDGVGCEACHGGAEKWVETHAAVSGKHTDNVARGMYPSEQPLARAKLCVSCHMGDRNKFVTHAIIGAGHPRLRFELNVFSFNQPAHYVVDEDYVERKGTIEGINLWLTGQLESARRNLELLQGDRFHPPGMFPELAFYDCQSCHHSTRDLRWTPRRAGPGIRPGTLRLQKPHLVMLRAATEAVGSPADLNRLIEGTAALIRAGQSDPAAVKAATATLLEWIKRVEPWTRRAFSRAEVAKVRKTLVNYAANDLASDYVAAEQIVLGAESLSYSLGDRETVKPALDALFTAVDSDAAFSPARFAEIARSVQARF